MKWTFGLFEAYARHSLASMKYHHLILILAVSLALPTIALAKEKGQARLPTLKLRLRKSNRRYSTAYSNPPPQPSRNT